MVIDEAHHMFPAGGNATQINLADDSGSAMLVTVHPAHVSARILEQVNVFITVGKDHLTAFQEFCKATRRGRLTKGTDANTPRANSRNRESSTSGDRKTNSTSASITSQTSFKLLEASMMTPGSFISGNTITPTGCETPLKTKNWRHI
jgi:hypothetical protein